MCGCFARNNLFRRAQCAVAGVMWTGIRVHYAQPQRHTVTLRNAGPGAARFAFVPRPDSVDIAPTWLRVTPVAGFVMPGASVDITLSLLVDGEIAARLNAVHACVRAIG
jgi:hypothetical protein